ncbi:hypothetical protein J2S43_000430 [Catenuloplanes nepalensis]|uniref:Uncharacterized protein n=1 Tax=Catenuloplanes nepalensis TaxID=587533 RepID=A0ABT9MKG6_9ACTN|nr:hypothetical protein [Catenuloplanes nepalensis]MDP9791918.1 hypothetical protein [Catenuloplanes nepalensis]
MSGVEVITAALAAGSTASAPTAVSAGTALRSLLSGYLSGPAGVLETVESEPGRWRALIGDELVSSGAATDTAVLAVARRLLELTAGGEGGVHISDSRGVQVGDHNTQHNTFS